MTYVLAIIFLFLVVAVAYVGYGIYFGYKDRQRLEILKADIEYNVKQTSRRDLAARQHRDFESVKKPFK